MRWIGSRLSCKDLGAGEDYYITLGRTLEREAVVARRGVSDHESSFSLI